MKKQLLQWSTLLGVSLCSAQIGLDPTFGMNGIKELTLATNGTLGLSSVASNAYGSLYLYGSWGNSVYSNEIVAKTTPDGQLDTSFAQAGVKTFDLPYRAMTADVLLLPHGKLLLTKSTGGDIIKTGYTASLSLLDAQGNTAPGLVYGDVSHRTRGSVYVKAATLTDRGQYLLAAHSIGQESRNSDFLLMLVDKEGKLVPTFGDAGLRWIDFGGTDDFVSDVIVRENGFISVVGYAESVAGKSFAVASLTQEGQLDNAFGSNGKKVFQVSSSNNDVALDACIYGQDKLLIVGHATLGARDVVAMAQLDARTGRFDQTFDYDGKRILYVAGKNDKANCVAVTQDEQIYIGGISQQYNNVYHPICIKLRSDGSMDPGFGNAGIFKLAKPLPQGGSSQNIVIQDYSKPVMVTIDATGNKAILARFAAQPNMAKFVVQPSGDTCQGTVKFTPVALTGSHQWIFEGDYAPQNTTEPSPTLKFWKAGFYNIKHVYSEGGATHRVTQKIFVDKAPGAYTNQYAVMPYQWPTTILGHSEEDFYASEGNTFAYEWTHLGTTTQDARYISNSYAAAGFYPFTFKVTRTATYEDLCPVATLTDTLLTTSTYFNCTSDYDVQIPPYQNNLVANGNFESSDVCPSQYFKSDFAQQCNPDQGLTSESIAIINSGGNKVLRQTEKDYVYDPFLLITRYNHVVNRDVWTQEVSVQEGTEYLFFTNVLNHSFEVEGDYTFPTLSLVVDDVPLLARELVSDIYTLCTTYKASKTGTVKLRIVKTNGAYFSDGNIELDNIIFGPTLLGGQARKDLASPTSTATTLSSGTLVPNPAVDMLRVGIPEAKGGSISLYSLEGSALVKQLSLGSDGEVSVSDFKPGMYLAKVHSADGIMLATEKLIITE